ncbi:MULTISPECIES: hypothetical protein [Kitasatospora]|uniref:Uncharacterized protein n=2 Tax=Kitasatospora TaxID=2063 RepID=A0ABT1IV80_9ACTN|nr:hypothetical protein [Kitasatospora paracochleata]MCP2309036.1 hypothetical protein [Kitasatospora paracochleata]
MPAVDQRSSEDERTEPAHTLGVDPGDADTWEIVRVHCPACDRPIALIGDEERLPQHAVLPSAWHPFSPKLCPGSGAPTDELPECEEHAEEGTGLAALLTRPRALDWRTQPFSHAATHRPVRAPHVPAQRTAPVGR